MEYWAEIIEAAKTPTGVIALVILAIMSLAVIFFHGEKVVVRLWVFAALFIGAGFLVAPLLPSQASEPISLSDSCKDYENRTLEEQLACDRR